MNSYFDKGNLKIWLSCVIFTLRFTFSFQYYLNLMVNFGWDYTMEFDWIRNNTAYKVDYIARYDNDKNNCLIDSSINE